MNKQHSGGWNRLSHATALIAIAIIAGCKSQGIAEGGAAAAGVPSTVHLVPAIPVGVDSEVEITVAWASTESGDKTVELTDLNGGNTVYSAANDYVASASKPAPYINGIPYNVRFTIKPGTSTTLLVRVKNSAGLVQYTREFPVTAR